jgi:hypothetical protein
MTESPQAHTDDRRREIDNRSEQARLQVEQECAIDYRHAKFLAGGLFVVFGGVAGSLLWIAVRGLPEPVRRLEASGLWPALFLVIAAVGVPVAVLRSQKYRTRQAKRSQREIARIAELSVHIKKDDALADLLSFNFELMDRFVGVALTQARMAYNSCLTASSAGLLILLGGTAGALATPQIGMQITVATLTGAGTALSAFIAHTFQKQYGAANRQMNFYYGQPLVHCYLLHAEWLAQRDLRQEKAHLVEATLEAGRYAQMYLVDMVTTDRSVKPAPAPVTPLSDPHRQETFGVMGLR